MSSLMDRASAIAQQAREREDPPSSWWHIRYPGMQDTRCCVSPPLTLREAQHHYRGCTVSPMSDEEVARWKAG